MAVGLDHWITGIALTSPYDKVMAPRMNRVVSAPGKVLIAGGYLILDPEEIGLVLALSARIYVHIAWQDQMMDGIITVTSPQFLNATWKYKYYNQEGNLHVENLTPESSNDYVRITISYVLAYIGQGWRSGHPRLSIKIYADNDYYSQSSCSTYEDRVRLPKFNNLNKPISEVNKTGLGSSAALITALTGALLSLVGREAIESPGGNRLVHNLAQAAHCAAQGKVGSGFDIAAAVYGSCIYRRFDPELLQPVLLDSIVYTAEFRERLRSVVDSDWEMQITPFTLPSGLRVVMGDVTGGTATPSMVRSVLNWKKHHADASKVWKSLGAANREFISRFADIPVNDQHGVVTQLIQGLHQTNSESDTSLGQTVKDVAACFDKIRGLLRLVGQQASVPIEPPTQTALLDDSLKVNGVSIAGVPGAGGYDAIFCLIADDIRVEANTESTIDRLFAAWKEREVRVCPLLAQNDPSGLLLSSEEEETE